MRFIGFLAGRLGGGLLLLGLASAPVHAQPGSTAALKDSFGGTTIDSTLWTTTKNLATATESGGTLNLTPNTNTGAAYAFISSTATYALTGLQVAVKAVTVPNNGNVDAQLSVQIDSNNYVKWMYQSGTMTASYAVAGVRTTVATVTYSASTFAWWRIHESRGTVYCESSSDGAVYTVRASVGTSNVCNLSALHINLYIETSGSGLASPGKAAFASLNVPPAGIPLMSTVVDTLGGTSIGPLWTIAQQLQGSITEAGGTLNLALNGNAGTPQLVLMTARPYTLTSSAALVNVKQVVSAGSMDNKLVLQVDGANGLEWSLQGGNLWAITTVRTLVIRQRCSRLRLGSTDI